LSGGGPGARRLSPPASSIDGQLHEQGLEQPAGDPLVAGIVGVDAVVHEQQRSDASPGNAAPGLEAREDVDQRKALAPGDLPDALGVRVEQPVDAARIVEVEAQRRIPQLGSVALRPAHRIRRHHEWAPSRRRAACG